MLLPRSLIALLVSTSAIATPVVNSARCEGNCTTPLTPSESAPLTSQWASVAVPGGLYTLSNDLWGQSADPSGTQCTQLLCADGDSVSWKTQYDWGGDEKYVVKSWANIALDVGLSKSLQVIKAIHTTWKWSYEHSSSGLAADVAYDFWLSDIPGSVGGTLNSTFEVMIWLSARGDLTPSGSVVAANLTIGCTPGTWRLATGPMHNWKIFTFVADQEINDFGADLKPFFDYLIQNQSVPSSSLLVGLQAGTEPYLGNATLKTESFTAAIN